MGRAIRLWVLGGVAILAGSPLAAQVRPAHNRAVEFEAARKLQQTGKPEEAFLAYAAIPGAQHMAARIARPEAKRYLALLAEKGATIAPPLARLVEADLHLALRDKTQALACCRAAAERIAASDEQGWASGHVPVHAYLVEPPSGRQDTPHGDFSESPYRDLLVEPFTLGPGSHRDNWLLRRFIALEAWDDAAKEFARVWELHRGNAQPHLVNVPVAMDGDTVVHGPRLVRPAGFGGRGLQFALDYAFFLRRINKNDMATAVLVEPLLAIDMDRNPNMVEPLEVGPQDIKKFPMRGEIHDRPRHVFFGASAGVSRKEFIRLTHGAMKTAGKEAELTAVLEQKIAAGENRLRRVLARVRSHQGKMDESLALELAYIKYGSFGEAIAAYRSGVVYEEAGKPAEAVAAFEKLLALPPKPLKLPDPEEAAVEHGMMAQMAMPMPSRGVPTGGTYWRSEVIGRLQRLYGAVGKPEKAFELSMQTLEADPSQLGNLGVLEQLATRAKALDREKAFHDWLERQLAAVKDPMARAGIHWVCKDYAACTRSLAETWKQAPAQNRFAVEPWYERFRNVGKAEFRALLTAIIEVDPRNAKARLQLLDLQERFEGPEVVALLESLLESDASFVFTRGKGDYNRTRFRNYFDLTYRLLRLYQRENQPEKLLALGLRLAAGERPFGKWWAPDPSTSSLHDDNDLEEDLSGCLALVIEQADAGMLAKLETLWRDLPDMPAKRQLVRRRAGAFVNNAGAGDAEAKDIGWADVPPGVRLIAASETVLSLAHDDRHVYAGYPWGVAVYNLAGEPVTRIALGEAARDLATVGNDLWAGTPKGLFRIDRKTWQVSHLWLHGDVPEGNRYQRSFPGAADYWFDNGVYTLAADGEDLWIGLHRNIQRLNTRTMALRAYSFRELKLTSWAGFDRILPDGEYVWASSRHAGMRRFDRRTDTWEKAEYAGRPLILMGRIGGTVLASGWVNDELRDRPAVIDRQTLKVTPLLIEGNLTREQQMINGPFSFYGTQQDKLVFGPGYPAFVLDKEANKLRPLALPGNRPADRITSLLPKDLQGGALFWEGDPLAARAEGDKAVQSLSVRQTDGNTWTMLRLPRGDQVIGKSDSYTPRYEYPREDWPFRDIVWDHRESARGLVWVSKAGANRGSGLPGRNLEAIQSSLPADLAPRGGATDVILGDTVFAAVQDAERKQIWLCTNLGLAVLDAHDRVLARFTRKDGLCGNRVTSGVNLGGKLFFSTGWADHGGGLLVADPATAVFTARFQSDGLATDKLARIEKDGEMLRLIYDVEYGRGGREYNYRHFPPGHFHPATGEVTSGGPARHAEQTEAYKIIAEQAGKPEQMVPCLGGFVVGTLEIGGKTYVCGTRGLAIITDKSKAALRIAELQPAVAMDPYVKLEDEARRMPIRVSSADDLAEFATHANPFVRNRALGMARHLIEQTPAAYLPVLKTLVSDEFPPNRPLVLELLGKAKDPTVIPLLEPALRDADKTTRQTAALAMARLGKLPPLEHFEEMLTEAQREGGLRNIEICQALASHATREVFALLLRFPLTTDDYEPRQSVFKALGASLREKPELADVLLRAYTLPDDPGPGSNFGQTRFAQEAFKHAGRELLPVLHKALQSKDRVVRSNAARACGAIGDAASAPRLIEALDLESGLSRASIVWALGELRAREALPRLAALYVDARNDEKRRAGAGFRFAQAQAQNHSQYEAIGNLQAISSDWDELKLTDQPRPIDPRNNEPLLTRAILLDAVRKIGPRASQEFYRKLAAEADAEARREAAQRLADGAKEDVAANLPVLRNLLADNDASTRAAAAVSLLMLDQKDVEKHILAWLGSPQPWDANQTVEQLERVKDRAALGFARAALEDLVKRNAGDSFQSQRIRRLLDSIPR